MLGDTDKLKVTVMPDSCRFPTVSHFPSTNRSGYFEVTEYD